jgi:hypothetical protein
MPNSERMRHGCALFWGDAPPDAWLVASWKSPDAFCSRWFRVADLSALLGLLVRKARIADVYIGMALRSPTCQPSGRGTSDDAYGIASLWVECDHMGGVHTARNLPTPVQLGMFLRSLPFQPSLTIDSGGGAHIHLLLKELWILDTPTERARAQLLLRRVQRTVQLMAEARGWTIDSTSDLARVLRLPGTFNHKGATPVPVTVLAEHPRRYNPIDLENAVWLAPLDAPATPPAHQLPLYPPGDLQRILDRCGWMRHCFADAANLSEPEWYAALSIIGRCQDGEAQAHTWSQPYPRYDYEETRLKLGHALAAAGPRTCRRIRYELGGEPYCQRCPAWGKVKSPVTHSLDDGARLRVRAAASWRPRYPKGR